eukprot:TRINITY_DN5095_c0_g1_i1.p1 TRINITY_DN5095_c0_g1~~TRINITY_DN5095_c0_g1_i1.p1  ORF type:complete len:453 (+),score=54.46 TRINITY_DN5095_c0_g1_i1:197-1360(+)
MLAESVKKIDLSELPDSCAQVLKESDGNAVWHDQTLTYLSMSCEEIFQQGLPPGVDAITSFETVGHIAHLNLRDQHLPFKHFIGQVVMAKNAPRIRTVVNKTSTIKTEFRTFPMEVIAGEEDFETQVKETECKFNFNFREVYWNSRLGMEHGRLVETFKSSDVICDMTAGVGPFAVPAARKRGCTVHANDLNPRSFHYLKENIKLNKVVGRVIPFNMDARDFVRYLVKTHRESGESGVPFHRAIINLPAMSIEFLDVYGGLYLPSEPLPTIHCYCFSSADDIKRDVVERIEASIGAPVLDATVHDVRNVAPRKFMVCVTFTCPRTPYQEYHAHTGGVASVDAEATVGTKRTRANEDGVVPATHSPVADEADTTDTKRHCSRSDTVNV